MSSRNRAPLKALHPIDNNQLDTYSASEISLKTNQKTCDNSSFTDCLRYDREDFPSTPVMRALVTGRTETRRSPQHGFSVPLRASSYREDKTNMMPLTEDIRHHFPIRGTPKKQATDNRIGPSTLTLVPKQLLRSGTKRPPGAVEESSSQTKQIRYSDPTETFMDYKPAQLAMGLYVKEHPRYHRRRSGPDSNNSTSQSDRHSVTSTASRLSPICPVPIPEGFPFQLPVACTAVSLPWDVPSTPATHHLAQCTAETQTSPTIPRVVDSVPSDIGKHSKFKRQSSGSTQLLSGLRKTFGNLRRAISAERLQRASQISDELAADSGHRVSSNQKCRQESTQPTTGLKFRPFTLTRSSTRSSSNKCIPTGSVGCTDQLSRHVPSKLPNVRALHTLTATTAECIVQTTPEVIDPHKLVCHVAGKYADGSLRVILRRSSTLQQFGFFIARDSQGIYISRLGSVRCAAQFWDIFHVGDRILEVQGVSCIKLEVEDVKNLIRRCELAEFRIKPARSNRISLLTECQN
ncbi:hypothetical protein EG68_09044 [Paragonimus skrjabini miyazakii]|uniref:PDZ domain-containing protein n=1 Tax=Paragonimus skrjabini miyazakii TaxID=59628 RepID=A0A8S9YII5_9TREM|nr:hypothetical protein EG68_09044 [Paragonimus skrjabini miyazakii]